MLGPTLIWLNIGNECTVDWAVYSRALRPQPAGIQLSPLHKHGLDRQARSQLPNMTICMYGLPHAAKPQLISTAIHMLQCECVLSTLFDTFWQIIDLGIH